MPTIRGERLLADLHRLAQFGRYETGVHRPTYSPDDMAARRWVTERMREAGLEPTIDGIGTVLGTSRARGRANRPGAMPGASPVRRRNGRPIVPERVAGPRGNAPA